MSMSGQADNFQIRSQNQHELKAPMLFRSSTALGWENLVVESYHEPDQLESWIEPVVASPTLILLTHGTMLIEQRQLNGDWKGRNVRQGEIFLRPGQTSSQEVRWKSLSSQPMQTLHIQISNRLLINTLQAETANPGANLTVLGRSWFSDPLLLQIGQALNRELEQPGNMGKLYVETIAQFLAVHLLRNCSTIKLEMAEQSVRLNRQELNRLTEYISLHLDKNLALAELAALTGFSSYHFARLFRRTTGKSPHQYVLQLRLERACQLLKHSRVPLSQVATECGFASQSHLTQVFKRTFGVTPQAYRHH